MKNVCGFSKGKVIVQQILNGNASSVTVLQDGSDPDFHLQLM
jgi:hypothetical protein